MQAPLEALMTIINAIPDQTVILAPAAAALCQRILSLLTASTEPAVRAYWLLPSRPLTNLGIWLSELGRTAEASAAHDEAMKATRNQTDDVMKPCRIHVQNPRCH
jgi:hypothetical protein